MTNTGILGIGVFLPEQIRRNDWWPDDVVENWRKRIAERPEYGVPDDEGRRLVFAARDELSEDPFSGCTERRVMSPDMSAIDMEAAAAERALNKASVDLEDIDLLLLESSVPDRLTTNIACSLHERLGLPKTCFTLTVEGICNGFQQQFTLADAMIRSGRARRALLVQSSSLSRVLPYEMPHSAIFGDGATAVVVGPVSEGKGLLGAAHRTNGTFNNTVVTTVAGARWFDPGRLVYQFVSAKNTQMMVEALPELARDTIHAALAQTQFGPLDVDFYASHQGVRWYRRVTQTYAGLDNARYVETFPWAASLISANMPLVLSVALDEGLLHDGDLVVTQGGGSGVSISSLVLRWGR
jgi:3-oxoacyl-[acyl-carrier-protein] synthase-3